LVKMRQIVPSRGYAIVVLKRKGSSQAAALRGGTGGMERAHRDITMDS
jgi:hypothetical protein